MIGRRMMVRYDLQDCQGLLDRVLFSSTPCRASRGLSPDRGRTRFHGVADSSQSNGLHESSPQILAALADHELVYLGIKSCRDNE
jgi:hypothetical protein